MAFLGSRLTTRYINSNEGAFIYLSCNSTAKYMHKEHKEKQGTVTEKKTHVFYYLRQGGYVFIGVI